MREWLEKNYAATSGDATVKQAIRALTETVEAGSKNMEVAVVEQGKGLRFLPDEEVRCCAWRCTCHRCACTAKVSLGPQAAAGWSMDQQTVTSQPKRAPPCRLTALYRRLMQKSQRQMQPGEPAQRAVSQAHDLSAARSCSQACQVRCVLRAWDCRSCKAACVCFEPAEHAAIATKNRVAGAWSRQPGLDSLWPSS